MLHSESSSTFKEAETDGGYVDGAESAKRMTNFSYEEALVFDAIMEGKSLDELWRLFAHPDKAQRVKVASALAAVNAEFTHNEESGYPEKRNQFWVDLEQHLPDIRNALSEALIASAKEGATNGITYTLAWMPGQGRETLELFAWAAKHHSDVGVRESSIYYLAYLGAGEAFTGPTLRERSRDPVYSVRKVALEMRYRRFTGEF